jgi:hypothetical protein
MRKALLVILLLPILACAAQSPFDGTWKIYIESFQLPEKPDISVLQNGMYQCPICDPKINVKADGTDQPIQGSKFFDTFVVKVVDNNTVEFTSKKGGKVLQIVKSTASADGKMITEEGTSYDEANKEPLKLKTTSIRIADGPAGSHAISGTWRLKELSPPEKDIMVTFKSSPDGLMMSSQFGQSYDAAFDGKEYPVKDPAGGNTVSLKKVNGSSIDVTNKRDGKIVSVNHLIVSADGKTLTMKNENKENGTTNTITATKQ